MRYLLIDIYENPRTLIPEDKKDDEETQQVATLELMKRAELQRIFGVPSDLGSVHGLPEMQPFFIAWGENGLSPWLSQESTYAEIIRKGSSSPDSVAAAESARKTERADDGNVGNGAEGSALSDQDGDRRPNAGVTLVSSTKK
jgi:hypothetical protein